MRTRLSTASAASVAVRAQMVGVLGALVDAHLAHAQRSSSTGGRASTRRSSEARARELARMAVILGRRVASHRDAGP